MAAITSISLAIDSSSVSLDNVLINEVETFNRDQSRRMTFTRDCVLPEDDTWLHKTIELAINGSIVFTGTVANREAVFSDDMGISYAYTAQGIEAKGDDWPVVSPFDGTTTVTFNQATTDVYIVIVGFQAVFNHANVRVPEAFARAPLKWLIVYPN